MAKNNSIVSVRKKADKLYRANRLDSARPLYQQVLQSMPTDHDVWLRLGKLERRAGEMQKAELCFRRAIELSPGLLQAYAAIGDLFISQGRLAEAESALNTYVALAPQSFDAHYQLGRVLRQKGNPSAAIDVFNTALSLGEGDAKFYFELGGALNSLARYEQALAAYQKASELEPNNAEVLFALGAIYQNQGNVSEAAVFYERAAKVSSKQEAGYFSNMARLSECRGEFEEAQAYLDELIKFYPDVPAVRTWRGESLLCLGRFEEGWVDYEWRMKHPGWQARIGGYNFSQPLWDGSPLAGKTLLVCAEQGLGDTLQFCRYLPLLHAQGARIIFYCQPELISLLGNMAALSRIEMRDMSKAAAEQFDFHVPLMSLPYYCGTTRQNIPAQTPYLTLSDESRERWRDRLQGAGLKVGLVWAGSSQHARDQLRSCPLTALAPLFDIENVNFYSLQKGKAAEQIKSLPQAKAPQDLSAELNDFTDTAAVVENLDLVISVDTAVAHLVGALGRPVWTLIYWPPEWRWLLEGDDSPWYPSMRLFRRAESDNWNSVIERVAESLNEMVVSLPTRD